MNLKGGYKILSLVTLVLIASVDGTTATDITDANTLEQLDSLKEFLDVSKQLKPILLRVKPSKEKVVMAELSRVNDVTFMIHAKLDGYELNIVVSFEQDEETLLWSIDEAQYLYVKTVNSEVGIKGLIQADKDILSQIVYDEDNNVTILPYGFIPTRLGDENQNYYFDYDSINDEIRMYHFNSSEQKTVDAVCYFNGGKFKIENITEFTDGDFILSNGQVWSFDDTYYIYKPITQSGTKLYRHKFLLMIVGGYQSFNIIVDILTPSSTPYTKDTLDDYVSDFVSGRIGYSLQAPGDTKLIRFITHCIFNGQFITSFNLCDLSGNDTTASLPSTITDTVTEL